MAKEFGSLAAFAEHIGTMIAAEVAAEHVALERSAKLIQKAAKAKIGEYQESAPPFVAWAPLAESTQAERARLGYPEDEPLLRDGTLRDSIQYRVGVGEAQIGSDLDIAVYQELGTDKIPPRSFLGGAAVENGDKVAKIVGETVALALVGKDVHQGRIDLKGDDATE